MDNKALEIALQHAADANGGYIDRKIVKIVRAAIAAYEAARETGWRPKAKFKLGDRVSKTRGSSWTGRVVGVYETSLTPIGYCVESVNEPGSVQIYPEAALAAAPLPEQETRP